MIGLLDVNVLVALLVPEHQHHRASLDWFGWATCAVTELGVIRVCAQLPGGAWPAEATADLLLLLTATSRDYVFWVTRSRQLSWPKRERPAVESKSPTGIFSV